MSDVKTWSTTAASNSSAAPNGWPENMSSAGLNDSGREVMAAIKRWYEDSEWIDRNYGYTVTRLGATSFKVVGLDATGWFTANRRVKLVGATTAYGFVEGSSYAASDTTVTVSMDAPGSDVPTSLTSANVHHSATLARIAFSGTVPTATVVQFAGAVASIPDGYLLCDGAELEKVDYPALWTAFGGHLYGTPTSPSTQFLLPDLGGKVAVGYVAGGDGDGDYGTLGGTYGAKTLGVSTIATENESADHYHRHAAGTGGSTSTGGATLGTAPYDPAHHTHDLDVPELSGATHENRQPSIVMLWIIKT